MVELMTQAIIKVYHFSLLHKHALVFKTRKESLKFNKSDCLRGRAERRSWRRSFGITYQGDGFEDCLNQRASCNSRKKDKFHKKFLSNDAPRIE